MSLFDDLLAKTQSNPKPTDSTDPTGNGSTGGSAGSAGQQDDPLMDTPITIGEAMPIVTETLELEQPQIEEPIITIPEPSIVTPVEENNSIIFDPSVSSIVKEETDTLIEESPFTDTIEPKSETDWPNDIINNIDSNSPLFDMMTTVPTTTPMPEMDFSEEEQPIKEEIIEESVKMESNTFRDTAEYIGHAIEEVGSLIGTIDSTIDEKVTERDDYKIQKEHYTNLELKAEAERQRLTEERSHAKKMKTYLEHEMAKTTVPAANDEILELAA